MADINRKIFKIGVLFLLLFGGSVLLFAGLYRYDNKYTASGNQPVNGMLCLDDWDLAQTPVIYLIHDWEFYPGQILKPEDFQGKEPDAYKRYVSIGDADVMEHGYGTYRLILSLPDESRTYAMEIPEIFSSYKLYVGDDLFVAVGDPDPENYQAKIQNRTITFRGGGYIQMILNVNDQSYLYSGMTYPPSFGTPLGVNTQRGIRIFIHTIAFTVAILITILAGYFFSRIKKKNYQMFMILGIFLIGYTTYPLLHTYFEVGIWPWYGIELFCSYGALFVILLFHNEICGRTERLAEIITAGVGIGFLLAVLFAVLVAVFGGLQERLVLSDLLWALKWAVVSYLLVSSILAVREERKYHLLLFFATLFYGISMAMDNLYPIYEPIYGGWFTETGGMGVILVVGYIMIADLVDAFRFQLVVEEHTRQTERMLQMQKNHYEQLTDKIQEARKLRHDMRQHMRVLSTYLNQNNILAMKDYLTEYEQETRYSQEPLIYCENMAVDAVLQYYVLLARKEEISVTVDVKLPKKIGISDMDICTLLGNLLENSMEGVKRQTEGEKSIVLIMEVSQKKILLELKNTYNGVVKMRNDIFYSTKHEGQGIGTESVKAIAEKSGGFANFDAGEKIFRVVVFLPMQLSLKKE